MKKIVAILMLAGMLTIGGMSLDAKTSAKKKSTKAKTTQTTGSCKTCKGTGTITCKSCSGYGILPDGPRSGYGCKACGGKGYGNISYDEPGFKLGSGKVKCPTCKGKKK